MKGFRQYFWLLAFFPTCGFGLEPLGAEFNFQGELRASGLPAQGAFDLRFRLFDAPTAGAQIGAQQSLDAVNVVDGLFNVLLNFGSQQFAGEKQWLEIEVRPSGVGSYTLLLPRSQLSATPYAWSSAQALSNSVTGQSVVDQSITAADINASSVQRRVAGACPAGSAISAITATGDVSCELDDGTGTVRSVDTGIGLGGGPITTSGTLFVQTNVINSNMLLDGTVHANDVNTSQIQRRVTGQCAAGSSIRQIAEDGTVQCQSDAAPGSWLTGGNSGLGTEAFLGTTDEQALVLRSRNAQSLRLEASSVLSGGAPITANVVAGSSANQAAGSVRGATIGGGGTTAADPEVSLASANTVLDHYGVIAGGLANQAGDGQGNLSDAALATIGGGRQNFATAFGATVAGGITNRAQGQNSTVSGGNGNRARGTNSTVSGGVQGCAGADHSWVAGRQAKVRPGSDPDDLAACDGLPSYPGGVGDIGTFVWADSTNEMFVSSGANQFLVRATGGAVITGTSSNNQPMGNRLRVDGTLRVDQLAAAGSVALCRNADNQLSTCSSSIRYKTEVRPLDLSADAMARLQAVSFAWAGSGEQDIGLIAEEVAAIDPRLVVRNERGDIEGVKYDRINVLLVDALQKLQERVAKLEAAQ